MNVDIIIVTYNSSKWIKNGIKSISESDFDLSKVNIFYVDNNSTDDTKTLLQEVKKEYEDTFKCIDITELKENKGFGYGNNVGAKKGNGDCVFCLNIDTTLEKNTLKILEEEFENDKDNSIGAWECRQSPYEHPKFYDPINREVSWGSGACIMIRRKVYEDVQGYDENIFMYAEDVDLSWRIRMNGYKIVYARDAIVNHYSYSEPGEIKPIQFTSSLVNFAYLRFKYVGFLRGVKTILKIIRLSFSDFVKENNLRSPLMKHLMQMIPSFASAFIWGKQNKKKIVETKCYKFLGWDYEDAKKSPFEVDTPIQESLKASVIVRTHNRPNVLKDCLDSLLKQTYKNFEVVIVEDGEPFSEELVKSYGDDRFRYIATNEKVGRTVAGNIGLENAQGDCLCFLDDDDAVYPNYIYCFMSAFLNNDSISIAHAYAFKTKIEVLSLDPYKYTVKEVFSEPNEKYDKDALLTHNQFPIQAVMFKKEVYKKLGGFDESLDVLEDWDLWLKYSRVYDFYDIERTTSVY